MKYFRCLEESDLDLEVLCPICAGRAMPPSNCEGCQGRRWVLTDLGERILDLLRRYGFSPGPASVPSGSLNNVPNRGR